MPSSQSFTKATPFRLEPASAWLAIIGVFGVTLLLSIAGLGTLLRVIYPLMAFLVGIFLYVRTPLLFNGYNWWIWFLTPLLRRVADYYSSYDTMSLMLTAPYLVTLITGVTVYKNIPNAHRQHTLPFVLATVGVLYSFFIGILGNSPITVVRALLDWLPPVLYGFHVSLHWRNYPAIRQNTQRIFLWATLITGAYGVYQYMVAPAWDTAWLRNVNMVSFGKPEPQGMRVWSTMNSPAAFSSTIMAGLILLFTSKDQLQAPAAGLGYLAFLLSLVRAAWGAWVVGLFALISSLQSKLQIRLLITISIITISVIPLTLIEPFNQVISDRFDSFSNVQGDSSYQARQDTYAANITVALSQFIGRGLGGTWVVTAGGQAGRVALDSGVLDIFFTLGWLGALPYLSGIGLLLSSQFQDRRIATDTFASAARSITLALFSATLLGPFTTGISGMVIWGFLGIGLAARKYNAYAYIHTE